MASTIRKISYILGAGFSYGTGHKVKYGNGYIEMPVQNTLFELIFKYRCRRIRDLDETANIIRKYFNPSAHKSKRKTGADRHSDLKRLSVEEVVTFLEEMARDLNKNDARVFKKTESELRRLTIELIAYLSTKGPLKKNRILKTFCKEIVKDTDTIITFNWDTLIDRVLKNTGKWHPAWGYGKTVRSIFNSSDRNMSAKLPKKHPILFKLHGSINWQAEGDRYSIITSTIKESYYDKVVMMPPKMLKREIWGDEPTEEKTDPLRGNWAVSAKALYKKMWNEAEEHLSRSKKIVFIGYSFPAADTSVWGLLRRAFAEAKIKKKQPEIIIVDPNAKEIAEKLKKSFQIEVPLKNQFLSLQSYVLPHSRK